VPYIRSPIVMSWRRSPFEGLMEHARLVRECLGPLRKAVESYLAGDMEEYEKYKKEVLEREHQADIVKSRVRNHLPKAVFMPVDKGTFLMLLREEDAILDYAEDVVVWLGMRKTPVPEDLKKEILDYLAIVEDTVKSFENAMSHLGDLLESSFSEKERKKIKEGIKQVHEKEYQADVASYNLSKKIFTMEETLGAMGVYHILKTVNLMDQIANHAENAADRLRALIAK